MSKPALLEQLTATPSKVEILLLEQIGRGVQLREARDPDTVASYAEAYRSGATMPPVVVFHETLSDNSEVYHLADGQHRVAAARKAELTEINAIIKKGDRRAAILYAAGANAQHGLPMTNADKRKVVATLLDDAEWRTWTDSVIAEHAHVSDRLVAKIRKEVGATAEERTGKDGKKRRQPKTKVKDGTTPNGSELKSASTDDIDSLEYTDTEKLALLLRGKIHNRNNREQPGPLCMVLAALNLYGAIDEFWMQEILLREKTRQDAAALSENLEGLMMDGLVEVQIGDTQSYQLTAKGAGKIAAIIQSAPNDLPLNQTPAPSGPEEINIDAPQSSAELTVHQVAGLLADAIKSSGGTATAYAKKHNLHYVALANLLAAEIVSDGSYGEIYDHALTLRNPTPIAAPAAPAADAPAPQQMDPPQGKPLAQRRLERQREIFHEHLLKGKPQWKGDDADLFALALICGVPTRATAWCDAVRATARDSFIDALRTEIADRARSGETVHRRWPDLRVLCHLWGIDFTSVEVLAERAIPE